MIYTDPETDKYTKKRANFVREPFGVNRSACRVNREVFRVKREEVRNHVNRLALRAKRARFGQSV